MDKADTSIGVGYFCHHGCRYPKWLQNVRRLAPFGNYCIRIEEVKAERHVSNLNNCVQCAGAANT